MRTLEEIEDDEINARLNKQVTANNVIHPDDLRNRLLYYILVQVERIANSLFMQNQMIHDTQYDKCCHGDESYPASPDDIKVIRDEDWPHEWTDEEIKHSRENPDPLDVAEEG